MSQNNVSPLTLAAQTGSQSVVVSDPVTKTKKPRLYKVILLNDDFTPMEFVVEVLQKYFHHDHTQATEIMLQVHYKGQGICGVYSRDIAETKVAAVMAEARNEGYPLQCISETE